MTEEKPETTEKSTFESKTSLNPRESNPPNVEVLLSRSYRKRAMVGPIHAHHTVILIPTRE